jgi:hypothetical protein
MTSGFWRRKARAYSANPICSETCFWLVLGKRYSMGFSAVRILFSGVLTRSIAA